MSSKTQTPSKAIACNREFADGTTCNRPVVPVFGCWPEECTQCACRILATRDGYELASVVLEEHYTRLRELVIAASIKSNPWAAKDMHARFTLLDKLALDMGNRRLMARMNIARMLDNRKETASKTTNVVKRENLGHRWTDVSQARAMELKRAGFDVRFIGVAWQVELS